MKNPSTVLEPNREPDFMSKKDNVRWYHFWFDESIVKEFGVYSSGDCYYFKRVEKIRGPRYMYKVDGYWLSITGDFVTTYADEITKEIEQGRNNWLATKAIEETLK